MEVGLDQERIFLKCRGPERQALRHILKRIQKNYRRSPSDFTEKEAAVWYSTRGCRTAGMSAEDTAEWIEHLHQFREENLKLLDGWLDQLESPEEERFRLLIPLRQVPSLLTVLNDHRLLAAAQSNLGEAEMRMGFFNALQALPDSQKIALFEVELLAHIMEAVLRVLPGSGNDQSADTEDFSAI